MSRRAVLAVALSCAAWPCAAAMATHALARTVPLRQAVPARASACMKQAPKGARGSSGSAGQPLRKKQKVPRLPRSRGTHQKLALRQLQRSQLEADVKLDASTEASMGGGRNGEHARPISGGSYPALVLNADYQPLSYLPLSLWSWQDSIRAVCRDTVNVVATYDRTVKSPSAEILLPSVIVLKKFSQAYAQKEPALTRRNLFMRDDFSCQYCGVTLAARELTYDHVHPRKLGGETSWTNTVTACSACNNYKGSKLLTELRGRMKLKKAPRVPRWAELHARSKHYPPKRMHESWHDFF